MPDNPLRPRVSPKPSTDAAAPVVPAVIAPTLSVRPARSTVAIVARRQVLREAGRTYRDLVLAMFPPAGSLGSASGDPCPCGGKVKVRTSRVVGDTRVQELECNRCGGGFGRRCISLTPREKTKHAAAGTN